MKSLGRIAAPTCISFGYFLPTLRIENIGQPFPCSSLQVKTVVMTPSTALLILIPVGYLLGAIPFGLIVGKTKGIDVRKAGSGNIGATNVGRLLGRKFFFIVFLLDLLKSFLPMMIASHFVHQVAEGERDWRIYLLWMLIGFAAVLGHMFSIFLRFKGGKGVATSAGLILGCFPFFTWPGLVCVFVFFVAFFLTRYVSVGSISGAIAFPLAYLAFGELMGWPTLGAQLPLLIIAILIALMIVFKHRGNIARLRAGTEQRMR